MRKAPPPSKSAERIREYLELIEKATTEKGSAKKYDVFRRAMNEAYTKSIIDYLKESLLIEDHEDGYWLTSKGRDLLEMLTKRRDLVGLLTRELSRDRIKPYS